MWIFLCALDIEIDFLIHFVATIPIAFAFVITLRNYKRQKNFHNLLFLCAWLSYLVWGLLNALVIIIPQPFFVIIAGVATILLGFFTVIFLDTISRVSIDPIKLVIVATLSVIKIMTMIDSNTFVLITLPSGQLELSVSIAYSVVGIIHLLCIGAFYIYYLERIHKNAPIHMKHASRQSVWGAIIMGGFGPLVGIISPNFAPAVIGIGASLTAFAFFRQPHLAYILPFKTYRLMVIDVISGLPLFSHEWINAETEHISNFELFSAMLTGVNGVLQESLQKGGVREIRLERSLLIMEPAREVPFFCIIITTKCSASLRSALKCFTKRFEMGFGDQIPHVHDTTVFTSAQSIVDECFPFVPTYD